MVPADPLEHSRVEIPNPGERLNWVLYASRSQAVRLVVFVHGFAGKPVSSWYRFPDSGRASEWWRASDMLFVGYESWKERPGETAAWLRDRLNDFYPELPAELLRKRDAMIRVPSGKRYDELLLVGHSLGGFVVRLALYQQARIWLFEERDNDPAAARPPLLDAQVRLFSPASAGFDPAGLLGMLAVSGCLLSVGNVALHRSPAFTTLKKGSDLLISARDCGFLPTSDDKNSPPR